jgi:hypothetical protein
MRVRSVGIEEELLLVATSPVVEKAMIKLLYKLMG